MKWEQVLEEQGFVVFPNEVKISKASDERLVELLIDKKITMDIQKKRYGIYSITVYKVEAPQLN